MNLIGDTGAAYLAGLRHETRSVAQTRRQKMSTLLKVTLFGSIITAAGCNGSLTIPAWPENLGGSAQQAEIVEQDPVVYCDLDHPDSRQWFRDADGDGHGSYRPALPVFNCKDEATMIENGFSLLDDDCNDDDPEINPEKEEIWYDGVDQNCDKRSDFDADADGHNIPKPEHWSEFDDEPPGGWGEDCDDTDRLVNPSSDEIPDGVDDDCDGKTDESPSGKWYCDLDGDGMPGSSVWVLAEHPNMKQIMDHAIICRPQYFGTKATDPDEQPLVDAWNIHEVLDGIDNDGDGRVDEHARRIPRPR